eukprot:TRINITY_DN8369_c0_g1_i1.p1 TRINITY_DN8369_c0_g1~~TRINITY_DN8369_c0_g1_i1.p1  ORF type:complete len:1050 (-),score=290.48 TRINITY_DN8369_c0_g1_i1:58-2988(-)
MKASSISLLYQHPSAQPGGKTTPYLINLVDSPGHVDFSSEVSTAVRTTDGAMVLVDVIEGVLVQTHAVLYQAWREGLKPCLVLNKIDRLITQLHFSTHDAWRHLLRLVEQMNAIVGTFHVSDSLEQASAKAQEEQKKKEREQKEKEKSAAAAGPAEEQRETEGDTVFDWTYDVADDAELYFSPEKGNVLFSSAADGWGFTVPQFAKIYAEKLGMKEELLRNTLWGEFFFNAKLKRVTKNSNNGRHRGMFELFVLQPIWQAYQAAMERDEAKCVTFAEKLKLKISPRELKSKDAKMVVQALFQAWLPLSPACLGMVVQHIPSPKAAQVKLEKIWPALFSRPELQEIAESVRTCNSAATAPLVCFISKMFVVTADQLPADIHTRVARITGESEGRQENQQHFIGFARVYSGTLTRNQSVYVLGPRYDPSDTEKHVSLVKITQLYCMMGRELQDVNSVPAGNVVGIGGLGDIVLKTATITNRLDCVSFPSLLFQASPVVRVALEPQNPSEMGALVAGLQLLNQADPCVQVLVQETGEHVLIASGELHLERCLKDLREKYAKIELIISSPLVFFRETILNQETKEKSVNTNATVTGKGCTVTVSANAMDSEAAILIDQNSARLKLLFDALISASISVLPLLTEADFSFFYKLVQLLGMTSQEFLTTFIAFAPKNTGPNLLFSTSTYAQHSKWAPILRIIFSESEVAARSAGISSKTEKEKPGKQKLKHTENTASASSIPSLETPLVSVLLPVLTHTEETSAENQVNQHLVSSMINGVQLATSAGPLCAEPMMGVIFNVQSISVDSSELSGGSVSGAVSGQLVSTMKNACTAAFSAKSARLMEAIYMCHLQTTDEVLGAVYAVLGRRRAKILEEEMKEGTQLFSISALLPIAESFGFSTELRTKTSGAAQPQLVVHGWQIMEQDPFNVLTAEDIEQHGELGEQTTNLARKYMNEVRKRKGLAVEEKIVEHAEKQRTLGRNK